MHDEDEEVKDVDLEDEDTIMDEPLAGIDDIDGDDPEDSFH